MSKNVVDVGQCNPDHGSISRLLAKHFDVAVHRAHSHDEAISMTQELQPALVLINRLLDADGSPGMNVLASLKADETTSDIPVMVVSNYAEAQQSAVAAGALQGFGKSSLSTPATLELLGNCLND